LDIKILTKKCLVDKNEVKQRICQKLEGKGAATRMVRVPFGSPDWTRTKRILHQNVDKQIGGVYFLVEEPKKMDYAR